MANKIITPSLRPIAAAITYDSQADHPRFSGSAPRAPSHKVPALRDNYFPPTDRLPPTVHPILNSDSCELAVLGLPECCHRPRRRGGCLVRTSKSVLAQTYLGYRRGLRGSRLRT